MRPATGLNRKLDLTPAKIIDPLCDCIGEVGVGLHIVEKLGVTLAINSPCLVRQGCGRLTLLPAPAVDDEEFVVALGPDGPEPDDRKKALGFGPNRLVREVELRAAVLR